MNKEELVLMKDCNLIYFSHIIQEGKVTPTFLRRKNLRVKALSWTLFASQTLNGNTVNLYMYLKIIVL